MHSMKSITPLEIEAQIARLGARIKEARVRRKWRQVDLAKHAQISRTAVEAIERGELTTGIGTYVKALWAMGINAEIDILADPGLDRDGLSLELSVQSKRVSIGRKIDNDF